MGEDEFYVTLPSNVIEREISTTNNLSNWHTNLATWINLKGEYEVGLAEISFTNSWFNVTSDQEIALRHIPQEEIVTEYLNSLTTKHVFRNRRVPAGRYNTLPSLVSVINKRISEWDAVIKWKLAPKLEFRPDGRSVKLLNGLSTTNEAFWVQLGPQLQGILNLPQSDSTDIENIIKLKSIQLSGAVDLSAGLHSIYCYTNIIKHRHVGNSMSQLLRRVEVPTNPLGEQIHHIFSSPHYHPVNEKSIGSIEILLKDDSNNLISFQSGRSIVTLHFRRKSNQFLYG